MGILLDNLLGENEQGKVFWRGLKTLKSYSIFNWRRYKMGSMYEMGCFLSCSYLGFHRNKELKIKELKNGCSYNGSKFSDQYKNNITNYIGKRIAYHTAYFPVSTYFSGS